MDYLALQGKNTTSYPNSKLQMNLQSIENSIKKKWELFVEYWLDASPDIVCKELTKDRILMTSNKREPTEKILQVITEVLLFLYLATSHT